MPPRGAREESRMSVMVLDATQRSQRREQDDSDGLGCHTEEPEKRAGCQRWSWMPPRGARDESRISAMVLDATQRSQRREQDDSDGPGCHPVEPETIAGYQRWSWMPPRGGREASRMSVMALEATQRSQRREQDVSDGPGCQSEETEKRAGCQQWTWMPPTGVREESRMSAMALDVTQRRHRREQDVNDGNRCHHCDCDCVFDMEGHV